MPRVARRVAESGFYHVILRGNGRQILFEDDGDREALLRALDDAFAREGVVLIAWCLMTNHVHLLVEADLDALSRAMHRATTVFARRFNTRAGHVGSVFDGRFKSVPVESDAQLVTVVRYIHENPARAGVCPAEEYPWSSYHEYFGRAERCEVGRVLDLVGGREAFAELCASGPASGYYFSGGRRIPDEEVLDAARAALAPLDPGEVRGLPAEEREAHLATLRRVGLSVRQIERVTGVGRYAIERALR